MPWHKESQTDSFLFYMSYSTLYSTLGIMKVWGFCPKMSPKNHPHISFTAVRQYWLGIVKPKDVLINPKSFQQVIVKF